MPKLVQIILYLSSKADLGTEIREGRGKGIIHPC